MDQKPIQVCPICGKTYEGYGNNPEPLNIEGRVCDQCNMDVIIPVRLLLLNKSKH